MDIRYVEIGGRWYVQWGRDVRSHGSFATERETRESMAFVLEAAPIVVAYMWSLGHVFQAVIDAERRKADALAGAGEPRESTGQ